MKYTPRRTEVKLSVTAETTLLPFLIEQLPDKSRNNVKSLLSRRLIAVDGKPTTRFDTPLVPGQTVSILPMSAPSGDALPFPILYEDDQLIVVNKPAKLLSVGNEKEHERTAYRIVSDFVKTRNVNNKIFVLHRLDRDTSGVLMFAKDPETKELFQSQWNDIVTKRGYIAVTEGVPKPAQDTIRSFLVETDTHLSFSGAPGPHSKEAITSYEVRRSNKGYALVDITIETGRKNQIRVHMKEKGTPIAGDKQYGASTNPIGRLCLHASELSFNDPRTGEPITFKAKMPRDFNRVLR